MVEDVVDDASWLVFGYGAVQEGNAMLVACGMHRDNMLLSSAA